LEVIEAPENPASWSFETPERIVERPVSCPNQIACPETEYFSEDWLELTGDYGPQADSVVAGAVRSVYVRRSDGRRNIGACGVEGEGRRSREVLRLPTGTAFVSPFAAPDLNVETLSKERREHIQQEQVEVMQWSARNGTPLYLGPCDEVDGVLASIYGDQRLTISIENFAEQVPVAVVNEEQERFAAASGPAPAAATAAPAASVSSNYSLIGVSQDNNCGGIFVLGQVTDANGSGQAGIGVRYSDDAGNLRTATTGSDGWYRFAANSGNISYVSLTAPGGASVSVTAQHSGGASCQYAFWRAGN
jgi:hypothetical protein